MKLFSAVFLVFLLLPLLTLKSEELSDGLEDVNELDLLDSDIENLIRVLTQGMQENSDNDESSDEEFPPAPQQPRKRKTSCTLF